MLLTCVTSRHRVILHRCVCVCACYDSTSAVIDGNVVLWLRRSVTVSLKTLCSFTYPLLLEHKQFGCSPETGVQEHWLDRESKQLACLVAS